MIRSNLAGGDFAHGGAEIGDVAAFPFFERPDARYINDGFQVLLELGAVNEQPTSLRESANKWRACR